MSVPATTILITRPKAQALQFAGDLRQRFGVDLGIEITPLLKIAAVKTVDDLQGVGHLIFTSVNGVNAFASQYTRRDIPSYCVGERTANMARGFGISAVSANGNADDLIRLIAGKHPPAAGTFLHVRGRFISLNIAQTLQDRGIKARELVLYDQIEQPMTEKTLAVLQDASPVLLPLFSPRTAEIFTKQTLQTDLSGVRAICISQKVADKLDSARFHKVTIAAAPNGAAMIKCLSASL